MSLASLCVSIGLAAPANASAGPACASGLERLEEARQVQDILDATMASLKRQRRARLRGSTSGKTLEQVRWMMTRIETQRRALSAELRAQERAYLRCVEAALDDQ